MTVTEVSATEPLIEISTLAPVRPTIEVDGTSYELRLLEHDFGVAEHQEFERDIAAFDSLWEKDGLTSKERKRLKALLDGIFHRVVMDVPVEVAALLTDVQRRQVISVFQIAPALVEAKAQEKAQKKAGDGSTLES